MRLWSRLRQWIRRRQFEADLAEEIRIHREMERDYRAAGGEGRFFGSEALALEQSREAWGFAWLDSFAQDIRYAWRGIRRAPGFALTVIGTIGLGLRLRDRTKLVSAREHVFGQPQLRHIVEVAGVSVDRRGDRPDRQHLAFDPLDRQR